MREQRQASIKEWAEKMEMLSEQVEGIKGVEERTNEYWSKVQAMDMQRLQEWVEEINNDRGMHEEDAVYRNDLVMEHKISGMRFAERLIEQTRVSKEDNDTIGLLPTTEKMTMTLAQLQGDSAVLPDRQKDSSTQATSNERGGVYG